MRPEYEGDDWAIYNADTIEVLAAMPADSLHYAMFSPPFLDLFVYSNSERDMGNAGSDADFWTMYSYFAAHLARVLRPGRIVGVHCTDIPARKMRDGFIGLKDFSGDLIDAHEAAGMIYHSRVTVWKDPVVEMQRTKALGLLHKQLRKDSAMSRMGMPDYILFFRKPGENAERIEHTHEDFPVDQWQKVASPVWMNIKQGNVLNGRMARSDQDEKHVCPLQLDIIENCLRLYTNLGDVVMDPFNGIGSTGFVALKMGRKYIGTELKPEYAAQAAKFLREAERSADDLFASAS